MDTTDEYIKMCGKAEEIQSHWKFEDGDYIYGKAHGCKLEVNMWSGYDAWDYPCYPSDGVWLPRQDQLQDFLNWEHDGTYGVVLIDAFYNFSKMNYKTYLFNNTKMTWEQLWLTFVMYKKYNKVWNDSEWIVV